MDWQTEAQLRIAAVHASMPEATPDELRKELRRHAAASHCGTSWGKKTWAKRCRLYLATLTHRTAIKPATQWPADIAFPWRGESGAQS